VDVLVVGSELGEGLDRLRSRNTDGSSSRSRITSSHPLGTYTDQSASFVHIRLTTGYSLRRPAAQDGGVDSENVGVKLLVCKFYIRLVCIGVPVARTEAGDSDQHSTTAADSASACDDGDTLKRERVLGVHYISRILRPNLINMDPFSGTTLKKYWILLFRVMLLLRR
jgi:hypothetical protein